MIKEVEIVFNSYLRQMFSHKPEVLNFLLNHERRPKIINICCDQIMIAEKSNIAKMFDISKYRLLIGECAKLFCTAALRHAEEKALSRAEMVRRIDEANRIKNLTEEFEADQKEFGSTKIISYQGSVAK